MDPFYKAMIEQLKEANKILQYEVRETEQKCNALLDLLLCDECLNEEDQSLRMQQSCMREKECVREYTYYAN